jgi:hypothetical protein
MRALNHQVAVEGRDPASVVREWRAARAAAVEPIVLENSNPVNNITYRMREVR